MFRFMILGLLRHGDRLHGYALVKEYRRRSGAEVSTGNFYRELQRLVGDRLIRSTANESDDIRRLPYEITEEGIAAFDRWLHSDHAATGRMSEDDISARVLFLADLAPAAATALLGRLQDNVWFWGKQLERERQRLQASPGDAVRSLLVARRLKYVGADGEFIEAMRAEYQRLGARPAVSAVARVAEPAPRNQSARKRAAPIAAAGRR